MLRIIGLDKFCSVINDFKASGIQVKVFGSNEEIFTGWFDEPRKSNTLSVRLVAMTSVGTLYCNERFNLDKDSELVEQANALITSLEITNAELSFGDGNGKISIK
ncbi:hypothetical protein AALG83_02070 [Christensenellaceae bacterium 44-20]